MENSSESLFHMSRLAFAELNSTTLIIKEDEPRGHKEWLQEDYSVNDEKFERIVRGYIKNNRISLYKGSDFREPSKEEAFDILYKLEKAIIKDLNNYEIYSGIKVGNVGEDWEPITRIR